MGDEEGEDERAVEARREAAVEAELKKAMRATNGVNEVSVCEGGVRYAGKETSQHPPKAGKMEKEWRAGGEGEKRAAHLVPTCARSWSMAWLEAPGRELCLAAGPSWSGLSSR